MLDEEKNKGAPVLGLDRFEQKVTGKGTATPKYKNDDLNEENGFKSFKTSGSKLPKIGKGSPSPPKTEKRRDSIHLAGQSRVRREPLPLTAIE